MTLAEDNGPERGGDDLLAAEYVLGVLPVEERQIASRRIDTEADFARLVDGWEVHFSPLAVAYAEIEPPPSVKPAIDRIRARRQVTTELDVALDVADPAPGPEAMAVAGDEKERINHCLEELDKDRAAAVRGAYLRGESYAELAARFSVPLNTMRTWLRRSLMKLRECLER